MSNRRELWAARKRVDEATRSLAAIETLPRQRGAQIRWPNGVIWTRVGDDDWRADAIPDLRYSSAHVAEFPEQIGAKS